MVPERCYWFPFSSRNWRLIVTEKKTINVMDKKVTLYKRPDTGRINYYFSHEGKKVKGSTGKIFTDEKCFDQFKDHDVELSKLVLNVMQGRPTKKRVVLLSNAYKDFYKHKEQKGSSPRTLKGYTQRSRTLLEYFGKKDITKLGTELNYEKYRKWKLDYYKRNPSKQTITYKRNGKSVKGQVKTSSGVHQVDMEIKLLLIILRWCQKMRWIPRDMFIDEHEPNTASHKETLILQKKEYVAITDFMKKDNPYYGSIVRFVQNTGIRYPGELTPLKWKHIDFDKSTISVNARKSKGNRVDSLIPMTDRVKTLLQGLYNRPNIPTGDDDFVFVNDKGVQVLNIIKYWKKTLTHLGIDTRYTMYSLRHLFAIRMIRRPEINVRMLAELLGHSSIQMVETTYARWISIDHKLDAMKTSEARREHIIKNLQEKNNKP